MADLITLESISKIYGSKQNPMYALKDVSLTIQEGEMIAIMGPSGSGKSTLLNILGLIDKPSQGTYAIKGKPLNDIRKHKIHKTRNELIGFVFQYFALLKEYTVLDNVMMPLTYRRMPQRERKERALAYLEKVGLSGHAKKKPAALSGGQQQRVAIARALVGEPALVLADEPTGNLDQQTGAEIMTLLTDLNREGRTIIIVTHDLEVAKQCSRVIRIVDGVLTEGATETEVKGNEQQTVLT